jgi:uncharacterized protein (TIGR03435 family)
MVKMNTILASLLCVSFAAGGHVPNLELSFQAVSIHPVEKGSNASKRIRMESAGNDPIHVRIENYSLLDLVLSAYGMTVPQLSGPNWLDTKVFNIEATMPEGATREQLPLLLQNLLVQRFRLMIRSEKKNLPVYEMVVDKNGPKFKAALEETKLPPAPLTGPVARDKDGYPVLDGRDSVIGPEKCRMHAKETMQELAAFLSAQMRTPVKDSTNLPGKYDLTISWDARASGNGLWGLGAVGGTTMPEASQFDLGPPLAKALSQQLGLKLEQKKSLLEVMVVDHVEQTPTDN